MLGRGADGVASGTWHLVEDNDKEMTLKNPKKKKTNQLKKMIDLADR